MKNKLKLILCVPAYLISVIFACIFTTDSSLLLAILEGVYFNPFKFKWMYFDGKEYHFDEDDSEIVIFSWVFLFFSCAALFGLVLLIINYFKLVISVILVIAIIILIIKAARYFVNAVFRK